MAESEYGDGPGGSTYGETLPVILEGWILQKGSYADFVAGTRREFALEFFVKESLRQAPDAELGWRWTGSYSDYDVTAEVVYRGDEVVVLDFGWSAYAHWRRVHVNGVDVQPGDRVTGVLSLGVDPFFYFEFLAQQPGMPPLIYEWDLEAVSMEVTPTQLVSPDDPRYPVCHPAANGPVEMADPSRETWRSLTHTQAWGDMPDGAALYRLMCRPTGREPTRSFTADR